jgi:predicted CoA-binding protein
MVPVPESVKAFLSGKRFVVAGVSRQANQPANAIFRKLKACGYEVMPVNPKAESVEGVRCYPDLASVPGSIDGVVAAVPPEAAAALVRQCGERGVKQIWFHRSFGEGSVSPEALAECEARGVAPIEGGCPLMYCAPVDLGHRCMRWWLARQGRVPV